ncbi:hypothetical protein [Rhodoferax sp. BAB1]|uniref:hypothetical protein n=1 Tax=Rhodoferax sp. BAB1 TaxID=2741720 RepID=UPI0015754762|nr:hypothetical protein [Rhodoferax sp. BAB1]QKO21451.1 hypothetical protein HTY51_05925 [Rhodoferax sp. BAB1]
MIHQYIRIFCLGLLLSPLSALATDVQLLCTKTSGRGISEWVVRIWLSDRLMVVNDVELTGYDVVGSEIIAHDERGRGVTTYSVNRVSMSFNVIYGVNRNGFDEAKGTCRKAENKF